MELSSENEWSRLGDRIAWNELEETYSQNFPGHTGRPAFSVRMALGALIIQKRMRLSDRALVKAIAENPYYQYFIGLQKFTPKCPFTAPALVSFRKRLTADALVKFNEICLRGLASTPEHRKERTETSENGENGLCNEFSVKSQRVLGEKALELAKNLLTFPENKTRGLITMEEFSMPQSILQIVSEKGFDGLREIMQMLFNEAMKMERENYLHASPYQRTDLRTDHANGFKPRTINTLQGEIQLSIPQTRNGGSDNPVGLKAARMSIFPSVPWQRCQFHLQQNATAHIPRKSMQQEVHNDIRDVFNMPTRSDAEIQLKKLIEKYGKTAPDLSSWLENELPEGFTVFNVEPDSLNARRKLRTTNMVEFQNKELKKRTRCIRVFPNKESLLRIASAHLIELDEKWLANGKTYLTAEIRRIYRKKRYVAVLCK